MFTATTVRQPALPSFIAEPLAHVAEQLSSYGLRLQLVSLTGGVVPIRGSSRPPCGPFATLTPTELRIARIVAAGATNRQVAEQLRISPKTVEAHLTHIYRKADVQSRAALAYRVARAERGA